MKKVKPTKRPLVHLVVADGSPVAGFGGRDALVKARGERDYAAKLFPGETFEVQTQEFTG